MPLNIKKKKPLAGQQVAVFETRESALVSKAIKALGGTPRRAETLRAVTLRNKQALQRFADSLLAQEVDILVATTGLGMDWLLRYLKNNYPAQRVKKSLQALTLVSRGPKSTEVLQRAGFKPRRVPAPNTTQRMLRFLNGRQSLRGKHVAVQEYGVPNLPFLKSLEKKGARVSRIPIYRWSVPVDRGPLRRVIQDILTGRISLVLFLNSRQVETVFQVAGEIGFGGELKKALEHRVVVSMGPHCSRVLQKFGVKADHQPADGTLATLFKELALKGPALLARQKKAPASSLKKTRAAVQDQLKNSLFMRACRGEKNERPPIWLMRQAGRYMKPYRELRSKVSMLELCKHPDLVAEVTVDAVKRLGVDAAIIFSDLLLIVEPMGLRLDYLKGEGPRITPPVRGLRDVQGLRTRGVAEALGYVYEAIQKTRSALPANIPLLGFAGAPFTLASYFIEGGGGHSFIKTKSFMYEQPKAWDLLLRKITTCLIPYLNYQIEGGAQAVQIFDSWVGCLSPEDYQRYALPHSRRLIRGVKRGTPLIHFGTQTAALLPLMKKAGGSVFGLDWRVPVDRAWKQLGNVPVMGNLDPCVLFSSQREIRRQTSRVLKEAGARRRRGFIFNLGHGILPGTPVKNVQYLVKVLKQLGSR